MLGGVIEGPNRVLREQSTAALRAELFSMLRAYGEQEIAPDVRDVLWSGSLPSTTAARGWEWIP